MGFILFVGLMMGICLGDIDFVIIFYFVVNDLELEDVVVVVNMFNK